MISSRDLKSKEIINVNSGKSLGFVSDIEIDLDKGRVNSLIVPGERNSFWGIFSSQTELEIKWKDIKIIGEDVILVNLPKSENFEETKETDDTIGL